MRGTVGKTAGCVGFLPPIPGLEGSGGRDPFHKAIRGLFLKVGRAVGGSGRPSGAGVCPCTPVNPSRQEKS